MREIISAGVVIYRVQHEVIEYLLLHHIAGHWDFAKGKIEAGETQEQGALRELQEETGLQTSLQAGFQDSVVYTFMDRDREMTRKTVIFFLGRVHDEQVAISPEHTDFVWLPYKEAVAKMTFENARIILEKANAFILNR